MLCHIISFAYVGYLCDEGTQPGTSKGHSDAAKKIALPPTLALEKQAGPLRGSLYRL